LERPFGHVKIAKHEVLEQLVLIWIQTYQQARRSTTLIERMLPGNGTRDLNHAVPAQVKRGQQGVACEGPCAFIPDAVDAQIERGDRGVDSKGLCAFILEGVDACYDPM